MCLMPTMFQEDVLVSNTQKPKNKRKKEVRALLYRFTIPKGDREKTQK